MDTIKIDTIDLTKLSRTFTAWQNCKKIDGHAWTDKHKESIDDMLKALPHGSGLDAGVEFDFEASNERKLIFRTSYHHMDDNGYYDGWTDHNLIITPTFGGFNIRITGQNKRDIKDYLSQMFYDLFTVTK